MRGIIFFRRILITLVRSAMSLHLHKCVERFVSDSWVSFYLHVKNRTANFVEIGNVYTNRMIIKVAISIIKLNRSYDNLYLGVTMGETQGRTALSRAHTFTKALQSSLFQSTHIQNQTHRRLNISPQNCFTDTGYDTVSAENARSDNFNQWLKWGGQRGLSPLLWLEPCNSMSPLIESIKCYFMPK